jgi:hypothetical protein
VTIPTAKNREIENALWPHTVSADAQARRLLYDVTTKAIQCCSVVSFGKGRLESTRV